MHEVRALDVAVGQATTDDVAGLTDVASVAAGLGYHRVWVGETFKVDPVAFAGHLTARLDGHPVGIGPLPVPLRTGPQLAMVAATLRGLGQPEPIELVVGASSPTMTSDWHDRGRTTLAGVEALFAATRAAASGARTDCADLPPGSRTVGFTNGFGPVQLRLGLAALGPRMLHLAGRTADRVMLNLCTPEVVGPLLDVIAEGAEAAGRPRPPVTVWAHFSVDPAPEAYAWGRRFLSGYVRVPGYREAMAAQGFGSVVAAAEAAGTARAIRDLLPDEMVERILGFGPAGEAQRRLADFRRHDVEVAVVSGTVDDPGGRRTLTALAPR